MRTMRDAIDSLERELFVGRERERAEFEYWLRISSPPAQILNVSGRGGIGKSALLRAFARIARQQGRPTVYVDSRDFPHTPAGLLAALHSPMLEETVEWLNQVLPVLLLDTFEEMGELGPFLQHRLLPQLSDEVRVVIAGRLPLGLTWLGAATLSPLVRSFPLGDLSLVESQTYLQRRGIRDLDLTARITSAAGGNPLALSLAADLALQLGVRQFETAPEWHLVVRSMVERLLQEVKDPQLQELLEVCAVVRQFDESTLAAVSGRTDLGSAFGQLCRLSVVRAAEHGLMLHDDVRAALAEDLRWRRPDRYAALRLAALDWYGERMRTSAPAEREWLLMERLFLFGDALVQRIMFSPEEAGEFWVEPARPADYAAIPAMWSWAVAHVLPAIATFEQPLDPQLPTLEAILRYSGTRTRVVRGREGTLLGFCAAVPICQESLSILTNDPIMSPLIQAYWTSDALAALPVTASETTSYYFTHLAFTDLHPQAVAGALWRDLIGLLAQGGRYLITTQIEPYKATLEALGFVRVPAARHWNWGTQDPTDGFVLDLSRVGVEPWIRALVSGRPVPRPLELSEIEREVREVLIHWTDHARLADSVLHQLPVVATHEIPGDPAESLRQAIHHTLQQLRAEADADQQLMFRALELGYLQKATSHERAAERLAVSLSTYYRLLRRGVRMLAETVSRT